MSYIKHKNVEQRERDEKDSRWNFHLKRFIYLFSIKINAHAISFHSSRRCVPTTLWESTEKKHNDGRPTANSVDENKLKFSFYCSSSRSPPKVELEKIYIWKIQINVRFKTYFSWFSLDEKSRQSSRSS